MEAPDVLQFQDYREYLRSIFAHRKERQRAFSYGSWARQLKLKSSSTLIMILNGQRHPGKNVIEKLADSLEFSADEKLYFEDLVEYGKSNESSRKKAERLRSLKSLSIELGQKKLQSHTYEYLKDWRHQAVREMVALRDFKEDPRWISAQLSGAITPAEVKNCLNRLITLRLIQRNSSGKLFLANPVLTSSRDEQSQALQSFHGDMLEKAQLSLKNDLISEREVSGVCLSVSKNDLPKAKELVRKFQNDMLQLMEQGERDSVYQLEVALFPLTGKDNS